MEPIKLAVLGIVQGISELLPVSSSGHLIIFSRLMQIEPSTLLLTSLHIGTSLAILVFFGRQLFKNFFTKRKWLFYIKIFISIIPAGIIGILFESKIENLLRANWIIAVSLIFWGILMIIAQQKELGQKECNFEDITWKQSTLMGLSQVIALIPGTSRSGITTLTGIALGLNQYTALSYSFILGLPVLLGSSAWEIFRAVQDRPIYIQHLFDSGNFFNVLIVVLIPFAIGLIALMVIENVKKEKWLAAFGVYRIIVGLSILAIAYL